MYNIVSVQFFMISLKNLTKLQYNITFFFRLIFVLNEILQCVFFLCGGGVNPIKTHTVLQQYTFGSGFPCTIQVRWASLFSPVCTLFVSNSISGGSKIVLEIRHQTGFYTSPVCAHYFFPNQFQEDLHLYQRLYMFLYILTSLLKNYINFIN